MEAALHYTEPRARRLKRIVVGHDLRSGGVNALESALVLARPSGASIRLVHTVEPHKDSHDCFCLSDCDCSIEDRVAGSGVELEEIIDTRIECRRRLDYEVRVGKPFHELILASYAWHADLIVVGGRERGSFHLLGDTAERLARKAFAPVLVTPKRLSSMPQRFLIATDFSLAAQQAAEAGIRLARDLGAQIYFLHVLDPTLWYSLPYDLETIGVMNIPKLCVDDVDEDWASFLGSLPVESAPWRTRTVEGRPAEMIVQYAAEIDADLIILGAKGRMGLERLFLSSVKEAVVRKAATAVLTIGREARSFDLPQIDAMKQFYR